MTDDTAVHVKIESVDNGESSRGGETEPLPPELQQVLLNGFSSDEPDEQTVEFMEDIWYRAGVLGKR